MTGSGDGDRKSLVVRPDEGREYDMGRMRAVFFADGDQADDRYSISEWSLEARTEGPGSHSHPEDHVFHVLEGIQAELQPIVKGIAHGRQLRMGIGAEPTKLS